MKVLLLFLKVFNQEMIYGWLFCASYFDETRYPACDSQE